MRDMPVTGRDGHRFCRRVLLGGRHYLLVLAVTVVSTSTNLHAQANPSNSGPWWIDKGGPIEVLSDTNGFNIRPYVKQVVARVKATWFPLVPSAAYRPFVEVGHVSVDFRLKKDGQIADIKYHDTSGNSGFDRAAYGAIRSSNPLPPLPEGFQCQFIWLRFHFYYNERPGDVQGQETNEQILPCATVKDEPGKAKTSSPNRAK